MPIQQSAVAHATSWALASSKACAGAAEVEHRGVARSIGGLLQRRRAPPTRGGRPPDAAQEHRVGGRLCRPASPAEPSTTRPPSDHDLVAVVDPQQRRVGPAGGRGVDVGAQRGRHGRRRRATAAGCCAARKATGVIRRRRCGRRAAGRCFSRASTSGSSTRSSLPSRTTPSTMSGRCRGEPPTSLCSHLALGDRAAGVRGQQILDHLHHAGRAGGDAEQPAGGLRGHHHRVRARLAAAGAGSRPPAPRR